MLKIYKIIQEVDRFLSIENIDSMILQKIEI